MGKEGNKNQLTKVRIQGVYYQLLMGGWSFMTVTDGLGWVVNCPLISASCQRKAQPARRLCASLACHHSFDPVNNK
jgi:hypothetical protein